MQFVSHEPSDRISIEPRSKRGVAILFVLGLDILIRLLVTQSVTGLMLVLASGALCGLSFYFLISGFSVDEANRAQRAERQKLPRKIIGSILLGLSAGTLAFEKTTDLLVALQFAIGGCVLALLSFGLDQLQSLRAAPETPQDRLYDRLDQIEIKLGHAADAVRDLGDAELAVAFIGYRDAVVRLIEAVLQAPDRHRTVKRHLGPLIDGALDAGRAYIRLLASSDAPEARGVILRLLDSLSAEYESAAKDYAKGDTAALRLEAEVLTDMLERMRPGE